MDSPTVSLVDRVRDLMDALAPVREVSDPALRDEIVACDRAAQMLMARQAALMAEVGRRAAAEDRGEEQRRGRPLAPHERRAEFVADEVAVTLSITKMAAAGRYDTAVEPPVTTSRSWLRGHGARSTQRKVDVVVDALRDVDPCSPTLWPTPPFAYAGTHTAPQLRQWLARRVVAADPGAAEIRRARATAERRVTADSPCRRGRPSCGRSCPQSRHARSTTRPTQLALAAATDDVRTMDQRRADALFDLLTGRADPPQVQVQVVVPATRCSEKAPSPDSSRG